MSELVPCRECRRHVRAGTSCPFCGAAPPASILRAAPRASGRFAMLFAGAIGLSACSEQAGPDLEPPPMAPPPVEAETEPEARPTEPEVEARPAELEARPAEPEPVEVAEPAEVEPVAPAEVTPVPAEQPAVIARPRPRRQRPENSPVPLYGGPSLQPAPDPGGAVAAYGGPSTMNGPDGL